MIFKKEKDVFNLIVKHMGLVEQCLLLTENAIETYIKSDVKEAKQLARQVDSTESLADQVRNEIRDKLFSGAYMPLLREDIYKLVRHVDDLANGAEAASDFFLNQRPVIPPELISSFTEVLHLSFSIIQPLKESLFCFFTGECDRELIHSRTVRIGAIESKADKMKWDTTKEIFVSPLEYSHKLHLKAGLDIIVALSDLGKAAADQIEIATMKSIF